MGAVLFLAAIAAVIGFVCYLNRPKPPSTAAVIGAVALGALAVGVLAVAVIAWQDLRNWFETNREPDSTGEAIKNILASGEYAVVANVLRNGRVLRSRTWKSRSLDPDTNNVFRDSNRVTIY